MRLPVVALAFLCLLVVAFAQESSEALPVPEPVLAADQNQALDAQPPAEQPDETAEAAQPAPRKAGEVPALSLLEIVFSFNNLSIAGLLLFAALTAYFIRTDKEP